jgi:hypothetical protein
MPMLHSQTHCQVAQATTQPKNNQDELVKGIRLCILVVYSGDVDPYSGRYSPRKRIVQHLSYHHHKTQEHIQIQVRRNAFNPTRAGEGQEDY